jgi:Uma2 family endonuclease
MFPSSPTVLVRTALGFSRKTVAVGYTDEGGRLDCFFPTSQGPTPSSLMTPSGLLCYEDRLMSLQVQHRYTPEEYLALERKADYRSEYSAGEIFAMSGASEPHNVITTNLVREISQQFKGRPCRVYASDMRVKVSATGLYTYPDVVALCGEPQFDDRQKDTLLNPTVLIEVLSPSTEAYDRGQKSMQYRRLPSLEEYLFIAQDRVQVEHYQRQPSGQWLLSEASTLHETITLPSISCVLALAEIYDKVALEAEQSLESRKKD